MKKCILILAVLISQGVRSQAYQPFDSTTVWNTLRTGAGTPCYPDMLYSYFVKGYIVNNGFTWYKVYANISQYEATYAPLHTPSCPPQSSVVTTSFMGMFNNDSVNKKVYFVPSATLSSNFTPGPACLEFDFNKSVGDTLYCYNTGSPTNLSYRINRIDSILFDGKYHKRFICFHTTFIAYSPNDAYFIEGIGATCGVFYSALNIFTGSFSPLVCFSGVSSSKYILGVYGADTDPTGIRDTMSCGWVFTTSLPALAFQGLNIQIYPNPFQDYLTLELTTEEIKGMKVTITDAMGQVRCSLNTLNQIQEIHLNLLAPGVYFLKIYSGIGYRVFKILKE